ncbi:MAG: hypothetical protein K6G65_06730 [Lachnospiraceae bacterium]|nr:hypothetical protein [Lachnospiraceae bacterium]
MSYRRCTGKLLLLAALMVGTTFYAGTDTADAATTANQTKILAGATKAKSVAKKKTKKAKETKTTIRMEGKKTPTTVVVGTEPGISGTVKTNGTITEIAVRVLDSKGKAIQKFSVTPAKKKYKIGKKINEAINFSKLGRGTYSLRLIAKATKTTAQTSKETKDKKAGGVGKEKRATLINQKFKVVKKCTISGATSPEELIKGQNFDIKGNISAGVGLKTVTAKIIKSGKSVQSKSVHPNTKKYSLSGDIDNSLCFGELGAGTYVYKVYATDVLGNTTVLINKQFKVENPVIDEDGLKSDDMFLKQESSGTCTLCAVTMMLRRRTFILNGDYKSVTQSDVRKYAWIEGTGLKHEFTYNDMKVVYKSISGSTADKKEYFQSMLKEHPEGIVIYDRGKPHAVLLTDYDSKKDIYYVADPSNGVAKGRVPIKNAYLTGSGQDGKIGGIDAIWYIP